jgi:hypothetical protein
MRFADRRKRFEVRIDLPVDGLGSQAVSGRSHRLMRAIIGLRARLRLMRPDRNRRCGAGTSEPELIAARHALHQARPDPSKVFRLQPGARK